MSIVHPFPLEGPAVFVCAQAGCRACLDALMDRHEGLVHHVLRRQGSGLAPYDDVLQEGRIALWRAILHFDPQRGTAFSTYAGTPIQYRIWDTAQWDDPPIPELPADSAGDPLEVIDEKLWRAAVREALIEAAKDSKE